MLNSEHRTIKVESEIKISEVDNLDWENCLIYVNGTRKDKDYVLKDNDSVIIRQYPSSTTAIFVGLLLATAVVVDLGTGKGLISRFIKSLFKQDVNDFDTGNTEQIPTISGAKNRSGANQPIPLLIGESMYTPITASQYYTDIDPTDGTDGENQYFHGLYCLGYKDVDLKSVSMGIYKLSDDEHNGTSGSLDCTNVDREVKTKNKTVQTQGAYNFNRGQTSVSLKVYADTGFTITSVNSLSLVNFNAFAEKIFGYVAGRTPLRIDNVEIVNKKIVVTVESIPSNCYLVVTGYAIVNITETAIKSNAHYKTSKYHQQLEIQQTLDENEEGSEVSLYPQKVVQENLGTELMHPEGADWLTVLPFSAKYPQKIQLEVQFQNLVKFNDEGDMENTFVTIGCAYSIDGGLTFSPFPAFSQTGGDITITDEGTDTFSDNSGTYRISKFYGKKNKTMRFIAQKEFTYSEVFDNVKNNIVEFRIFRINEDLSTTDSKYQYKCFASAIRTWCYDYNATKAYAEEHPSAPALQPQRPLKAKYRDMTARLGFTIKAGEEIQGTINELNVIYESRAKYCTITENNGVKTYTWSTEKVPTNNPASLALMVLEHEMRGEYKYDNTSLDYESFGKFYEWCQQTDNGFLNSEGRKYTANGVISKQFKTLDLVNQILACGHGKLTIIGNKYGVLFDKPLDTPVLLMNNQNILERKNTKNFDEDIDGYACRFIDCLNDYQEDTQIFVPDSVKESKTPDEYKLESVELPWITDAKRAYRMCMYQLACRKLRPESWEIKMGVDGAIADVGSLVAVQDDTILVGIGDGAQITELITSDDYITGIKVDYGFNVTDTTKTYAVQIQHADSVNGVNIRTYQLEDFSTTGVKDTLMFDEPIPTSRTVKPAENDIVSFGIHGMVSNDAIVMSKKENQDGTYTFVCVPYQSNIYDAEYGEIPDFVSNVTPPRDNGNTISEEIPTPTYEDIKDIAESVVGADTYICSLSMSEIGSAVTGSVYKDGELATGTLYYADFYGTNGSQPSTTGATGTVTNGAISISAVSNADKHLVKIFTDSEMTNLVCSSFVSYGATGSGTDSTSYWLIEDATTIKEDSDGNFTPSSINLTSMRQTGSSAPTTYVGRLGIAVDTGSGYGTEYTYDSATKSYAIPEGTVKIRCRLYVAGGTSVILDEDVIPVVNDGEKGQDGVSPTVTSTTMEYCQTSTNTQPSSGWGSMPSTLTAGYYLWTKTTITYSDNSTAISYSSTRNGSNGTNGTNGTDAYSSEISASAVNVATGTDRKPTASSSVNIVFKAFKGTTQLTAVASSSTTVGANQFRVTTPSNAGNITVTQSTNGTLNFAWTTANAIDATRSFAVTVAIGSTTNTVTKTITITASVKGATGSGTQGTRAIRYIGKSSTKPNSSNQTSGTPVSGVTPIVGDWYLCTNDGYVYYCTAVSGTTYTWGKITSTTDYRLLSCMDDLIVLHNTLTTNATLNSVVDSYTTALATGTLLAQKIFTNSIHLQGDMLVYDYSNREVFRIQNDGFMQIQRLHCDDIASGDSGHEGCIYVNSVTKESNNYPRGSLGVACFESKTQIFTNGHCIQALKDSETTISDQHRKSTLNLQSYGGNILIGDEIESTESNEVKSFIPIKIPAVSGNTFDGAWSKALGVIQSSLDLNDKTWKGTWASGKSYAVGDVVISSNVYYKCKTAHTSSSSNSPTSSSSSTYWTNVSNSGYVVFSNGLKIQWGTETNSSARDISKTVTLPISYSNDKYIGFVNPVATFETNLSLATVSGLAIQSANTFKIRIMGNSSSDNNFQGLRWFTIGY